MITLTYEYHLTLKHTIENYEDLTSPYLRVQLITIHNANKYLH